MSERQQKMSIHKKTLKKFKGIVLPKMKIIPEFTHPQAILGVYDFSFSQTKVYNSSKLYNG